MNNHCLLLCEIPLRANATDGREEFPLFSRYEEGCELTLAGLTATATW